MENEKTIKINAEPEIVAKPGPELEEIKSKSVAGVTDEELINKNVVGKFQEEEEEPEQ